MHPAFKKALLLVKNALAVLEVKCQAKKCDLKLSCDVLASETVVLQGKMIKNRLEKYI